MAWFVALSSVTLNCNKATLVLELPSSALTFVSVDAVVDILRIKAEDLRAASEMFAFGRALVKVFEEYVLISGEEMGLLEKIEELAARLLPILLRFR